MIQACTCSYPGAIFVAIQTLMDLSAGNAFFDNDAAAFLMPSLKDRVVEGCDSGIVSVSPQDTRTRTIPMFKRVLFSGTERVQPNVLVGHDRKVETRGTNLVLCGVWHE